MIQPLEFSMAIAGRPKVYTTDQINDRFKALPKAIQKLDGAVIYEGFSPVLKRKIVVIISGMKGSSQNKKTGPMAQIDILIQDTHPVEAVKLGIDEAICGSCPLRGDICYVRTGHGPASKWRKYNVDGYERITPDQAGIILAKHGVTSRLGAYGDPAMIPFEIWQELLSSSGTGHTSYTHQWKQPWFDPRHLQISMASIDHENTVAQLQELHGEHVRYYRLVDSYENLGPNEIKCPSDSDQIKNGRRAVQCAECGLCAGSDKLAKSIAIIEE